MTGSYYRYRGRRWPNRCHVGFASTGRHYWFVVCRLYVAGRSWFGVLFRHVRRFVQHRRSASRATRVFGLCFTICNRACIFSRLSNIRFSKGRTLCFLNVDNSHFYQRQPRDSKARRTRLSTFHAYCFRRLLTSANEEARDSRRVFNVFTLRLFMTSFVFFSLPVFDLRTSIILLRLYQIRLR